MMFISVKMSFFSFFIYELALEFCIWSQCTLFICVSSLFILIFCSSWYFESSTFVCYHFPIRCSGSRDATRSRELQISTDHEPLRICFIWVCSKGWIHFNCYWTVYLMKTSLFYLKTKLIFNFTYGSVHYDGAL